MPMENESTTTLHERIRMLELRNRQLETMYQQQNMTIEEQKRSIAKLLSRLSALGITITL